MRVGLKYKHNKTGKIYELVKIDKTPQATWVYISNGDNKAICYGKTAFLAQFTELKQDTKLKVS